MRLNQLRSPCIGELAFRRRIIGSVTLLIGFTTDGCENRIRLIVDSYEQRSLSTLLALFRRAQNIVGLWILNFKFQPVMKAV